MSRRFTRLNLLNDGTTELRNNGNCRFTFSRIQADLRGNDVTAFKGKLRDGATTSLRIFN
jgi:hypothetical protein